MPALFPDCMMPDGAEPCLAFSVLQDKLERQAIEIAALKGRLNAIVHCAGGVIEGRPTGPHNILQRRRHL